MQIYNTLTRKKEEIVPIQPGHIGIYACGPTVYNYIHIGNARPICAFDVLRRYLKYRGYTVTYVQNFTDVDDKIIKKANEEGTTAAEIAKRYIAEYKTDAHGLNVMDADVHPTVTNCMDLIIDIVKKLVDSGHATSGPLLSRNTASCPVSPLRNCRQAQESTSTTARRNRWTSLSGRQRNRVNPTGIRHGARADRAGTLNALPCPATTWARPSTSTAAVRI